ncbi:MAG: dTDP-4-dehydrorhamnose reductase [Chloroflexi bacterium]|nr:MAG: dTDP-4-dehydrorhamnose reductase [Chloroflexota bacterium]
MTHFLVTGASGLLGLNFSLAVDGKKHQVTGVDNRNPLRWINFKTLQANLIKPDVVERIIQEVKPDVILHCAANANVDDCETRPEDAEKVNGVLSGEIATAAKRYDVKMIHISTDAVFNGVTGNYTETDTPEPLSVYAKTKLHGEQAVLEANPNALVARVNFYGWSITGTRSLAEWFAYNLAEGKRVKGFTDILFCPMMVLDLVDTLIEAAEKDLKGIYHCVGAEAMSKYEFGVAIATQFGFDANLIDPASVHDGGLTASRSPNLTLSTEKLKTALGHPLPAFKDGLKKFHDQYRHGFPEMIKSLV